MKNDIDDYPFDGETPLGEQIDGGNDEVEDMNSEPQDNMDGDFDSAMTSAGYGTDEDYGYYGNNEE